MDYILNFDTKYPSDLPAWLDISHLYDGFEYQAFYKLLRAGIINPGEIKHSYIAFEAQPGARISLQYKLNDAFVQNEYGAIFVTQSPTAPSVYDVNNRIAFISSATSYNTWLNASYEASTTGMYYLHLLIDAQKAQTSSIGCISFDDIQISTPTLPLFRNLFLSEFIEPPESGLTTLPLTEKIYFTTSNKRYLNFLHPETDDSTLTWHTTLPEETTPYENRLDFYWPYYVTGTGVTTITYPYNRLNAGIGFKIKVTRGTYNTLLIKLNGVTELVAYGAEIDREFYFNISSAHQSDTVLEFIYDYKYGTYITISDVYATSNPQNLDIVERIVTAGGYEDLPLKERIVYGGHSNLLLHEMIRAGAYFRIRERVMLEGYNFDFTHMPVKEHARSFGLDGLGIYLDEYILSKTGYNKLSLREKTYDTHYTGRTGKVLVEITKAL